MIFLAFVLLADAMDTAKQEGQSLALSGKDRAISQVNNFPSQELIPEEKRGESFDPDRAKEEAKKCAKQESCASPSPELDYLRSKEIQGNKTVIGKEYFLERSENIFQKAGTEQMEVEEAQDVTIEKCQRSDAPYPISVIRNLQVGVVFDPGESKNVKVCLNHTHKQKCYYKKDAEKKVKELRERLSHDPTIEWYRVEEPQGGGMVHKYSVEAEWKHFDDAGTCDNYQMRFKVIREPKYEETGDSWVYENDNLLAAGKTPNCTFMKSDCLDATPSKMISGKEVQRQCWREKLTFLCCLPNLNDCPFLKNQNCELIRKECLKEGSYGCELWELTFKCYSKIVKKHLGKNEFYGLDEEHAYQPNDSFSEVAAKLSVFDELKKGLERENAFDARTVQVFKGQKMQCGKSVADKAMYDCCFSYSGLAKELGLKSCKKDEIALAEMRENGLCHYVGSYKVEFLELWKSRDEHVFCCFGSKLARVLQENARKQLNIDWGSPKEADCRGLSLDEISRLDFSKMDFSELYADFQKKIPESFKNTLDSFESKLREKIGREEKEDEKSEIIK